MDIMIELKLTLTTSHPESGIPIVVEGNVRLMQHSGLTSWQANDLVECLKQYAIDWEPIGLSDVFHTMAKRAD